MYTERSFYELYKRRKNGNWTSNLYPEITIGDAANKYGINWYTVREYMRQYRDLNHLPPMSDGKDALKVINKAMKKNFDDLESLSREELIDEVIKARVETERAKNAYAVKGGGQAKDLSN
ncbi:MAG: hypothetical protein V8R16_00960 [Bacilli bacterium]